MEVNVIKNTEINEQIRDREVRLIGSEGEQLGIMSARDAYMLALEKKLDLVKIAPTANPPVCKIMDYGKFKYTQSKKEKEAKKKQKVITVKEIRLGLNIEQNDLDTKAKNAAKFLKNGDRVKVTIRFRGREMGHKNQGFVVIDRFAEAIAEYGQLDNKATFEGRHMTAFFSPKK